MEIPGRASSLGPASTFSGIAGPEGGPKAEFQSGGVAKPMAAVPQLNAISSGSSMRSGAEPHAGIDLKTAQRR